MEIDFETGGIRRSRCDDCETEAPFFKTGKYGELLCVSCEDLEKEKWEDYRNDILSGLSFNN